MPARLAVVLDRESLPELDFAIRCEDSPFLFAAAIHWLARAGFTVEDFQEKLRQTRTAVLAQLGGMDTPRHRLAYLLAARRAFPKAEAVVGLGRVPGGFGASQNRAFLSLAVFNGALYAGTHNPAAGAELWRTDDEPGTVAALTR